MSDWPMVRPPSRMSAVWGGEVRGVAIIIFRPVADAVCANSKSESLYKLISGITHTFHVNNGRAFVTALTFKRTSSLLITRLSDRAIASAAMRALRIASPCPARLQARGYRTIRLKRYGDAVVPPQCRCRMYMKLTRRTRCGACVRISHHAGGSGCARVEMCIRTQMYPKSAATDCTRMPCPSAWRRA